jgi:hypothetical protein
MKKLFLLALLLASTQAAAQDNGMQSALNRYAAYTTTQLRTNAIEAINDGCAKFPEMNGYGLSITDYRIAENKRSMGGDAEARLLYANAWVGATQRTQAITKDRADHPNGGTPVQPVGDACARWAP